jgi:UDP-N-acetylmuramoyl-L-alanyl-D-glutamate--2,6-diaminopimelate ligase
MRLQELVNRIPGLILHGDPAVEFHGISYDSRKVRPGDIFVALRGERFDGAQFAEEAAGRGAAALASDRDFHTPPGVPALKVEDARIFLADLSRVFFQDPASRLQLVAITGTNGKTTTSFLLDAIFRRAGFASCRVGTLGMSIGSEPFPSSHTTPEASDLTAFLNRAVESGCTHGALEVSSHALALKRVFGTSFTIAVFSNLTPEHLDFHGDMESYDQATRLLFIPEGANHTSAAVINTDDGYGRRLASELRGRVLRYGFGEEADLHVAECRTRMDGTDILLRASSRELELSSRLPGLPNAYNIAAAAGAALCLGIDPHPIRQGIESLTGVPGRLEPVRCGQRFNVLVDYAHTPDALEKLLRTVRQIAGGRVITVFGCGGDRDRKKRPLMGEIAARLSDHVVATSDNPRTEDPGRILSEIETGLRRGSAPFEIQPDRREAIRAALAMAAADDTVVIAGKGHEDYQIIGSRSLPFDDRVVAQELILELNRAQGD